MIKSIGIEKLFPVQRQVIPFLVEDSESKLYRPNDVCVSAPTGSGKTLAFVIPIVQSLLQSDCNVTKIRALVILPVQDLAQQVHKVFQTFFSSSRLKIRLLTASKSFAQEQRDLVKVGVTGLLHSNADIVVATPGRLVEHINQTKGFDLTHLRFVIDPRLR